MAITVKKITLWRAEIENKPGTLANALEPLAASGADLKIVMGYRYPGAETKAAVEVSPVTGKKHAKAAASGGLAATPIPTLVVEGDNRPGLGHAFAKAIADAGINISFLVAQVLGRKYSAVFGFDSDEDARQAAAVMRKAARKR